MLNWQVSLKFILMPKQSAGILLYRIKNQVPQVFLVHPGGPFWSKKDAGVWSIPKGEMDAEENSLQVALREFQEETGHTLEGNFTPLKPVKQRSGKIVFAWIGQGDVDETKITSNTFDIEWPPKSGKIKSFPEVDRADWFHLQEAREKINPGQLPLLDELAALLNSKK
jgi:predicted NUDIX family NTP pyrophosphohydrolase